MAVTHFSASTQSKTSRKEWLMGRSPGKPGAGFQRLLQSCTGHAFGHTCDILSTREAPPKLRASGFGWSWSRDQSLPNMHPDFRLPQGSWCSALITPCEQCNALGPCHHLGSFISEGKLFTVQLPRPQPRPTLQIDLPRAAASGWLTGEFWSLPRAPCWRAEACG